MSQYIDRPFMPSGPAPSESEIAEHLRQNEETFGPTVTVNKVASMDEAVTLANATRCELGSAVYSKARGAELARRLRSGMTAVNSVISFAAIPALPFGGVGASGFGRIHGADGLKEFTYAEAVSQQRMKPVDAADHLRPHRQDRRVVRLADHRPAREGDAAAQASAPYPLTSLPTFSTKASNRVSVAVR